jgi:hypothetical protein
MRSRSLLPAIAFMMLLPGREAAAQNQAPPNDPAALRLEGGSIQLRYQGTLVLSSERNSHCVMCWYHSPHLEPARDTSGCWRCSMARFNLNVYNLLRLNSMRYDEA